MLPSDYPIRDETHPHWVTMFDLPHKAWLIFYAILFLAAFGTQSLWLWLLFGVSVALAVLLRWHIWQGEHITLTSRRIIRKQGVAETDWSEASLRLDRVSGVWVVQTVPGKLFGYATVEVEAPGSHQDIHSLKRLAHPRRFYETLRWLVFGEQDDGGDGDGDGGGDGGDGGPGGNDPSGGGGPTRRPGVRGARPWRVPLPDPDDDPRAYRAAMLPHGADSHEADSHHATQPLPKLAPVSAKWRPRSTGRRSS